MRSALTTAAAAALLLLGAAPAAAQVTFSGDARFRPRLDLDDRTGNPALGFRTSQFYYMYRVRLDVTASIGDGYYMRSRFAHNGLGNYARAGTGELPDVLGNPNNTISEETGRRPDFNMMYMYIGRRTPRAGFDLGLMPVPGFVNPLYDLHYYPQLMLDVPHFLYSNDGGFGAQGFVTLGPGRLTAQALLDREREERRRDAAGNTIRSAQDQYTLGLTYSLPVAGMRIEPQILKAIGGTIEDSPGGVPNPAGSGEYNDPLTIGANIVFPALGPVTITTTGGYTQSDRSGTIDAPHASYDGWLGRAKVTGRVGPGNILSWVDVARRTDRAAAGVTDVRTDFAFAWLNYSWVVHSGDQGTFAIGPAWRILDVSSGDSTLRRRHKIEINFDATFR